MKVVVTGGAGFIGSHTVDVLLERGYDVVVLDSLQARVHSGRKPSWVPAHVEFVEGDVTDAATLARALAGAVGVFHLAAYQDHMPDFSQFVHTNAESAALLFELVVADRAAYPVEKIVFASSQAVSGEGRYVCGLVPTGATEVAQREAATVRNGHGAIVPPPRSVDRLARGEWEVPCPTCGEPMRPLLIDEDTVNPGTAYAISKYAVELLADRLGRRYGIATACMRYTYVQGARNSLFNSYSGVARRFAVQLMNEEPPTVYEDGGQLRDFVHVRDVAQANVLAFEDERADFGVFNVGGGRAYTVLEFAERMIAAFGTNVTPLVTGEFRVGDSRHSVSDTTRIGGLGWRPSYSLDDNIHDYLDWVKPLKPSLERLRAADREMRYQGVLRHIGANRK